MSALLQSLESLLAERILQPCTEGQYRRSLKKFETFLGRDGNASDLSHSTVNGWVKSMQTSRHATTCRNNLKGILVLWNYLVETENHEPYNRNRLRSPKGHSSVVVAWTLTELKALLEASQQLTGKLNSGIPASHLMEAWIRLGFESGIRRDDLRNLTWEAVDLELLQVSFVQHKTKNPHTAVISSQTAQSLRRIKGTDISGRVFPIGKFGLRRWEKLLFAKASKLGFVKRRGAALGTLRKSHATEIFKSHGLSAAAESLGHVGGVRTVRAHYVDSRAMFKGRLPEGL